MPLHNKKEKLTSFVQSVLQSPQNQSELKKLMDIFSLTEENILNTFLEYNMDIFSHGNEIYDSHAIRIVLHIHNLLNGSWHIERQEKVTTLIQSVNPKKVIDLGFGVPSRYMKDMLSKGQHLTLCDFYKPTFDFAKQLINIWNASWMRNVSFLHADLADVGSCVGDYDLYVSRLSIEHVQDPTAVLRKYTELSSRNASFVIEVPIGPITPEHYYAWHTIEEAIEWFQKCGLTIINAHYIHVQPDVDLFAEQHHFMYGSYMALCKPQL